MNTRTNGAPPLTPLLPARAAAAGLSPIRMTPAPTWTDCRLCGCRLVSASSVAHPSGDDLARGLCRDCMHRPEAARFGPARPASPGRASAPAATAPRPPAAPAPGPRGFNGAEKSLIRMCLKNYMPAAQLLEILNDRAVADGRPPFTMDELWAEAKGILELQHTGGDWTGLRRVIAKARTSGLLEQITPQLIDDFSIVFQLSAAQRITLHDVVRNAQKGR